MIRALLFTGIDIGVTKRFPIAGRTNFELRFDMLNCSTTSTSSRCRPSAAAQPSSR
jgi:hypothetical protein